MLDALTVASESIPPAKIVDRRIEFAMSLSLLDLLKVRL
jgi:hypothetical protein